MNDRCYAINAAGGAVRSVAPDEVSARCLYPEGGFQKPAGFEFVVFDELKPYSLTALRFGVNLKAYSSNLQSKLRGDRAVLSFRSPFSIVNSMNSFADKYARPGWNVKTEAEILQFLKQFCFFWQAGMSTFPGATFINLHRFMEQPTYRDEVELALVGGLAARDPELPFLPKDLRCPNGDPFVKGTANTLRGTFFRNKGITKVEDDVLTCQADGSALVGFGGFRPDRPIEPERFSKSSPELEAFIEKHVKDPADASNLLNIAANPATLNLAEIQEMVAQFRKVTSAAQR
ncbi:MAG: hypothetical protein AAFQ05_05795 [Pseudomonadota bacterium]